ncbi:MAG: 2OG-Fe(II) oxygenase [Planctomycetaceae bacterium]|nr:2OG-Fe(II) oxygenase [Planctomycetaceae bacterium]
MTALEGSWREWIVTNLRRRCSQESIVESMVAKDFDPEFAKHVVASLATESASYGGNPDVLAPAGVVDDAPVSVLRPSGFVMEPSRLPTANDLEAGDRVVHVLGRLQKPEVLVLGNLLSDEECEELIRRSEVKLARSTTIDPQTGKEIVIPNRTSSGTFFPLNEDDFIARLDRRVSELLRWPVDHSEGIQILRYQVGGEYRPHFDYFPPENSGSGPHVSQGGQRIGTLIMYLNDVEDGGETIFPEIGLSVIPRRGHAVYFGYCNSRNEVDPLTLHGGAPVRQGVKWIATKWLRQHRRV